RDVESVHADPVRPGYLVQLHPVRHPDVILQSQIRRSKLCAINPHTHHYTLRRSSSRRPNGCHFERRPSRVLGEKSCSAETYRENDIPDAHVSPSRIYLTDERVSSFAFPVCGVSASGAPAPANGGYEPLTGDSLPSWNGSSSKRQGRRSDDLL